MFLSIEPHPIGLPPREFNKHLDGLLTVGQLNPDIIPFLNARQMDILNEVKKALVRLENKHEDD